MTLLLDGSHGVDLISNKSLDKICKFLKLSNTYKTLKFSLNRRFHYFIELRCLNKFLKSSSTVKSSVDRGVQAKRHPNRAAKLHLSFVLIPVLIMRCTVAHHA